MGGGRVGRGYRMESLVCLECLYCVEFGDVGELMVVRVMVMEELEGGGEDLVGRVIGVLRRARC